MTLSKGSLVITDHRLTNMVINRLRPAADGDIIVPNEAVCVAGTTAAPVDDPDNARLTSTRSTFWCGIQPDGAAFGSARIIRAIRGSAPFSRTAKRRQPSDQPHLPYYRSRQRLFSIQGGKLTTYRYMAEKTWTASWRLWGQGAVHDAEYPLDGQDELSGYPLSKRLTNLQDIVLRMLTRDEG